MTDRDKAEPPHKLTDDDRPSFQVPWHAEAYSLTQVLLTNGVLDRATWHHDFGAHLRAAEAAGKPDNETTYYAALVDALAEALSRASGPFTQEDVTARVAAWRAAYETTPHGAPVALQRQPQSDD